MFSHSFSKFSRNIIRVLHMHVRNVTIKKEILFFLKMSYFFNFSLKAANTLGFSVPHCTRAKNTVTQFPGQSCGLPILKDTAGWWYRAELFVIQSSLRTKNGHTYIHDKSRCYRWSLHRCEHCTLFPTTIRASWRVALVFHRSGAAAAFYRPFSKVPSCDRPAPSRYGTCPFHQETWFVGEKRVNGGFFDQKERESSYPPPVPKAAFII